PPPLSPAASARSLARRALLVLLSSGSSPAVCVATSLVNCSLLRNRLQVSRRTSFFGILIRFVFDMASFLLDSRVISGRGDVPLHDSNLKSRVFFSASGRLSSESLLASRLLRYRLSLRVEVTDDSAGLLLLRMAGGALTSKHLPDLRE
ncbi:hypothetical protein Ahia01_000632900, partial [Argonauta hians]